MEEDLNVLPSRQMPSSSEKAMELGENEDPAVQVRAQVLPCFQEGVVRKEKFIRVVSLLHKRVNELLYESRISREKRSEFEKEFQVSMKRIEESANEGSNESKYRDDLLTDISMTLVSRGIESRDDWRDYIETMERDGEVLADICDILNTDVLLVKKEVEKLQAVVKSKEALDKGDNVFDWTDVCRSLEATFGEPSEGGMGRRQIRKTGSAGKPGSAMEERSLEYAQILLDNLAGWPEHFQLVGALHKVEPHRAYNEVKQLALSIEQSKLMLAANRRAAGASWKNRSAHYRENRADREFDHPRDLGRQVSPRSEVHGLEDRGLHDSAHAPHRSNKTMPSQGTSESKKCYSCSRYGHISRDCPQRKARVNQIGHKEQAQVKEKATVSRIIEQARSLGMAVKNARVKRSALIGDRVVVSINLLDRENQALVDTGSMISILPVDILRKAQDSGYDVDALELVEESSLSPVFDASGNRMHFLGAVIVETELHGGNRERVAFHISKGKEEEIILGTNALGRLGIEVSIIGNQEGKIQQRKEEDRGDVTVKERVYVPPRRVALVSVLCSGDRLEEVERVIWPTKEGVAAGVYSIRNQEAVVPVFNNSDEGLVLKQGEEVGRWGTDKWHQRWEELNPLKMDNGEHMWQGQERLERLTELIEINTEAGHLDEGIRHLLTLHSDAFAVCERELSQTDMAEMTIDTGDSSPIKMKARPVPLGIRPKLKELLTDLLDRNIIEKSKSEWAFPIVLVEKKDGSIRLLLGRAQRSSVLSASSHAARLRAACFSYEDDDHFVMVRVPYTEVLMTSIKKELMKGQKVDLVKQKVIAGKKVGYL
ncbi:zinc knuckle [Ostertagia ostertagi]